MKCIPRIPSIRTPIPHIPTLISCVSALISLILTLIRRVPTLIPGVPTIPLIPFQDSSFWLLQIADIYQYQYNLIDLIFINVKKINLR